MRERQSPDWALVSDSRQPRDCREPKTSHKSHEYENEKVNCCHENEKGDCKSSTMEIFVLRLERNARDANESEFTFAGARLSRPNYTLGRLQLSKFSALFADFHRMH